MALATVAASLLFFKEKIEEEIHPSGIFVWLLQKLFEEQSNGAGSTWRGLVVPRNKFIPREVNLLALCQHLH